MQFHREKLKELILHVSKKARLRDLGSIKLNKVLWFSDITAYLHLGEPITGETYLKRQFGPVSSHLPILLEELKEARKIVVRDSILGGYDKKEYIALADPDLSQFSAEEISIVDEFIDFVCNQNTAESISELSHNRIWELAEIGEEIPYSAAFASNLGEINEEDIRWAKEEMTRV